jgi:hypothetical protein
LPLWTRPLLAGRFLALGVNGLGGVANIRFSMASRQTSALGFLFLGFFAMGRNVPCQSSQAHRDSPFDPGFAKASPTMVWGPNRPTRIQGHRSAITDVLRSANDFRGNVAMDGYMLDTKAFNGLVDGGISPELRGATARLYATHIQLDELNNTCSVDRRAVLLHMFEAIGPKQIPTETALWDVSKWGEAKWSVGGDYDRIFARLDALKRKPNNQHDALIAETAIKNDLTLVTNDRHMAQVCREFLGRVITLEEFLRESAK